MFDKPLQRITVAVCLFTICYFGAWTWYQYIFDVDGVGYATAAALYAQGKFAAAVNGYWSPLHSWLVAPLLHTGLSEAAAFKLTNGGIGIAILVILNTTCARLKLTDRNTLWALVTAALMLVSFAWHELAADLLLVLWLLLYFNTITAAGFASSLRLNLAAGLYGALAYLTKAYALPFFLLHFSLLHWWLLPGRRHLMYWAVGLLVCFAGCMPWVVALQQKYGIWTIGTSGTLNLSWYLNPLRNSQLLYFPPPFEGASSFWVDPWWVQEKLFNPFQSAALLYQQVRNLLHNTREALLCLLQISILAPLAWGFLYRSARHGRSFAATAALSFLFLLPAGYLLIHIELRFLWMPALLLCIAAFAGWQHRQASGYAMKGITQFAGWLVAISFVVVPAVELIKSKNKQQEWHQLAHTLHQKQLPRHFTSNKQAGDCMVVAHLIQRSFHTVNFYRKEAALTPQSMRAAGVEACLWFIENEADRQALEKSGLLQQAKQVAPIRFDLLLVRL